MYFSIIIPTLNEELFLPKLLDDLVHQSCQDFEVFVVDGGSSDKTVELAKNYLNKLNLQVLHSDKKNVSFQRNLGAVKAKGEYLVFFDADVRIPGKFLRLIKIHLKKHQEDFLTTYVVSDSDGVYDQGITQMTNIVAELCLMIDRPFIIGCDFIVKQSVFAAVGGFDLKIKFAEDYELAERLFHKGYKMTLLRQPRIVFSLRRFRREGRITALRKTAKAGLHILTKGHITHELFDYQMGGHLYKLVRKRNIRREMLTKTQNYMKKFIRMLVE